MSELLTYTLSDFTDLASLMQELSGNIVFTRDSLDLMLADPNSHLYVIREEGRIVACVGSEGISDLWNQGDINPELVEGESQELVVYSHNKFQTMNDNVEKPEAMKDMEKEISNTASVDALAPMEGIKELILQ